MSRLWSTCAAFVPPALAVSVSVVVACSGKDDHPPSTGGCSGSACTTGTNVTGHDAATDIADTHAPDDSSFDSGPGDADAGPVDAPPVPESCDDPSAPGDFALVDGGFGDPVIVGPEAVGGPFPGTFDVVVSKPDTVAIVATRTSDKLKLAYVFSSEQLSAPLAPGVYKGAWRYPDEPVGKPGFNVEVGGVTCSIYGTATFTILDLVQDPIDSHLVRLRASFTRTCDEGGEGMTGCIRFGEPPPPPDAGVDASDASDAGGTD